MSKDYTDNIGGEPVAFDMGISTLGRTNYWLWQCNHLRASKQFLEWYDAIECVHIEAYPFMKPKEKESFNKLYTQATKKRAEYIQAVQAYNNTLQTSPGIQINFSVPKGIYETFFEWERELRCNLDSNGLLMRKGDDASTAMM